MSGQDSTDREGDEGAVEGDGGAVEGEGGAMESKGGVVEGEEVIMECEGAVVDGEKRKRKHLVPVFLICIGITSILCYYLLISGGNNSGLMTATKYERLVTKIL